MGSTRVARHAGTKHAARATRHNRTETVVKVNASVDVTPKSRSFKKRVSKTDTTRPMVMPTSARRIPCPNQLEHLPRLCARTCIRLYCES